MELLIYKPEEPVKFIESYLKVKKLEYEDDQEYHISLFYLLFSNTINFLNSNSPTLDENIATLWSFISQEWDEITRLVLGEILVKIEIDIKGCLSELWPDVCNIFPQDNFITFHQFRVFIGYLILLRDLEVELYKLCAGLIDNDEDDGLISVDSLQNSPMFRMIEAPVHFNRTKKPSILILEVVNRIHRSHLTIKDIMKEIICNI